MIINDDLSTQLTHALAEPPAHLETLHRRLAAAARADGVLDVAYRTLDTPIGTLLLAATDLGLVRIAFGTEDHDAVLQKLADGISPRILDDPVRLDAAAHELDEYFAGRTVLHHLPEIGYGHTATYAAVAQLAGNPKAVRAVGSACATNPVPVIVPCHRVVRSDGGMGGYLGGVDVKRALLAMESA
jgi:methylated-DNA-[protein]-cysteine S-methyltransferase